MTWLRFGAASILMAILLAACGSPSGGTAGSTTATPSSTATPTPTPTATPSASSSAVVLAQTVGSMGMLLVAASNGHTLYTFDSDSPGVSRCSGACLNIWPALTIAAGQTPTGGAGVTGQLGTITRSDGTLQVTYKGLPLYYFHNDSSAGQTNGNYSGWSLVHP